jgi:hypothetical protein
LLLLGTSEGVRPLSALLYAMAGRLGKDEISLPMKAFLLLVTWLASNQPPSHYQVQFSSNETCEAARQQLIKDAERIGQARKQALGPH